MDVKLGQAGGKVLRVGLEKLADSRMLVQANSGGGKSWLLRLLAEQASGQMHMLILDPEGEFATLREKCDFLIVGKSGDVPVAPRSAALLARKLMELRVSAVLDLYDLKLSERREFVKLFLDALLNLPKELWHPTLVFLDEAHVYCPEKSHGESCSSEAVISLMCQGRKRGLCGILATQRLSKLHKDAAAEANNVLIGRTWIDVDQKRAKAILGDEADPAVLRVLPPGQFYGFGPAFSISGTFMVASGQVQTTHPKPGERHHLAAPQPSKSIQKHLPELAGLAQKAEQEIKDLVAAKARIRELEQQLKAKEKAQPTDSAELAKAKKVLVEQGAKIEQLHKQYAGIAEQLTRRLDAIRAQTEGLPRIDPDFYKKVKTLPDLIGYGTKFQFAEGSGTKRFSVREPNLSNEAKAAVAEEPRASMRSPASRPMLVKGVEGAPDGIVETAAAKPKCAQAILTCLAQYPEGRSKIQLALQTQYKHNGGGFNNALGALRSAGYIERQGEHCRITEDGLVALGPYEPLPTGKELQRHWLNRLGKCERLVMLCLLDQYPEPRTKAWVASRAGYEDGGGGFNNAIGRLRTIGLIEGSKDALTASADLFD